jgi:DNA-binding CsgD family transcriptional regulator
MSHSANRQVVLDASLRLQVVRARSCDEWFAGHGTAEVEVFGDDLDALRDWLQDQCRRSEELVAVTSTRCQTLQGFRQSHEFNQKLIDGGQRMTSYFDISGGADQVTDFIIGAEDMPYHLADGALQVKLLDRERVVVEGPVVDGRRSLMVLRCPEAVNATGQYLRAVRETAVRASEFRRRLGELTARQRVVAKQLEEGCTDEEIAEQLGVSVRTVRYEVARLLEILDVTTRFAAGVRYARMQAVEDRAVAGSCNRFAALDGSRRR